ncbi:MAG: hypothetical protein OIF35_10500, partial [Cellvibrionaceae bacterium]|nr:hypothetical protein [Cellvibrionaceae bacterium]
MENQSLNISQVLHKLEPGCLLLTPNSRLRRRLMQHFAKSHSADQGVCPSPAIFAFNQWCEENWLQ